MLDLFLSEHDFEDFIFSERYFYVVNTNKNNNHILFSPAVMWDIVDECGVTVFGTSAKWIAVQEERHLQPRTSHSLKTLKVSLKNF